MNNQNNTMQNNKVRNDVINKLGIRFFVDTMYVFAMCLVAILSLTVFVNTASASEITGTLNSNSNLSTGLSGTVLPSNTPTTPAPPVYNGGGGGGGGGGGSSVPPINPPISSGSSYVGPVYTFTKILSLGNVSLDVKNLQKFLNANNYKITNTGAGSPGKEITSFGALTKKALIKFQKDKGIPQTGILDTKTIKKITEIMEVGKTIPNTDVNNKPSNPTVGEAGENPSISFNRDLKKGDVNSDVKALQIFLNNNGFKIAKSGVGSPGKENSSFGELTKKALIQFQKFAGIPATGTLGPKTRAYLNK